MRVQITPRKLNVIAVHENLSQEVLAITVDKLRLRLNEHAGNLGRSRDWATPAGILVTIGLTFVTATFQRWAGLDAKTWHTIYGIAGVSTAGWLVVTLVRLVRAPTVDQLIEELKKPS